MPVPRLLVATTNSGKLEEISEILSGLPVQLESLAAWPAVPPPDETGTTFAENARIKAVAYAAATGRLCLADDSGLEVEALNGAPGVHSARFAGVHGDDAKNNGLLLERLQGLPFSRRNARFVCALALARPDGTLALEIEGAAHGRILDRPRGEHDFGYDPLFLFTEKGYAETDRGFAELEPHEKSRVSHRGRALRELGRRLSLVLSAPSG